MFKTIIVTSLFFGLASLAGPARAEVDEDFMQTVEDTHKSLTSNLTLQNAESSNTDANLLAGYFAEIEEFFVKKGDAQDGVDLAHKSRELVAAIQQTIAINDFGTAVQTSAELGRTCKACHKLYHDD
ncbi:hypothetical protein [Methyloterricola oryzae]|uniref:hypothetical protein n=1 Tax=Methyloterricola oryzae TaxID=1495050 RepID=UPI0005EB8FC2|nr:hypothetical protein [Methyloterricola oryzae]